MDANKKSFISEREKNENEDEEQLQMIIPNTPKEKISRLFAYKNLIIIGFSYFCTFTAFDGLMTLQSSIHSDPSVGFITMCVLCATFALGCIFLPNIVISRLGYKYSLASSLSIYVCLTLAHFYPKPWLMFLVAIIVGFASAVNWASSSSYIAILANNYAYSINQSNAIIVPKFFSIFYLIVRLSAISGNLISSLVLKRRSSFSNTTTLVKCGFDFCPSAQDVTITGQASQSTTMTLMWIYVVFGCIAFISVLLFLTNIETSEALKKKHLKQQLTAVLCLMLNVKVLLLFPISFFIGISRTFLLAGFTKAYITCEIGIENIGYAMLCFGVMCCITSIVMSFVIKWTGSYFITMSGALVYFGLFIFLFLWDINSTSKYILYVTPGLWAVAEMAVLSQVHAFYGVLFFKNKEEAFALFKLIQNAAYAVAFGYGNYLCVRTKLIIIFSFLNIGIILYSYLTYKVRESNEESKLNVELNEVTK